MNIIFLNTIMIARGWKGVYMGGGFTGDIFFNESFGLKSKRRARNQGGIIRLSRCAPMYGKCRLLR